MARGLTNNGGFSNAIVLQKPMKLLFAAQHTEPQRQCVPRLEPWIETKQGWSRGTRLEAFAAKS